MSYLNESLLSFQSKRAQRNKNILPDRNIDEDMDRQIALSEDKNSASSSEDRNSDAPSEDKNSTAPSEDRKIRSAQSASLMTTYQDITQVGTVTCKTEVIY